MHVFADLRPYICTFPNCKDELAQFTTRAAWADHELLEHRYDMMWNCPECSEKFAGTSDWEQHLHEMHQRIFTGSQLHGARITASQVHPRPAETEECPLCRVVLGKPRRTFVKHVARHMEEIALMALPRSIEEDSDGSSDSTDQISLLSKIPELLATNIEYIPLHTEEDWDKGSTSSINTLQESLDAEDCELQPFERVAEADEERKLQSIKSTAETGGERKLQPIEGVAETGGERKLQPIEGVAETGVEKRFQPVKSTAKTIGERKLRSIKSAAETDNEKKLPSAESSVKTGGESRRPPPPKERYWICDYCGESGMSIRFNTHCLGASCGRRKNAYAREYS